MRVHHRSPRLIFALLVLAGCGSDETAAPDPLQRQLDQLRDLTRPYQNFETARSAGYRARITDCMSDPQHGGMGFHFGKEAIIDGTARELEPEVVMYEPASNGDLKLVGVEYVVPFSAWTSPTPPSLFGQSFARNETFQVWALHVWLWKDNPGGIFQSWNPNVSCTHASTARVG